MYFTFSAITTILFFNSIAVLFFYLALKKNSFILSAGTRVLLLCMLLGILRWTVPFEFFFAETVQVKYIWPAVYSILMQSVPWYKNRQLSLFELLCYAGTMITIICVFRVVFSYSKTSGILKRMKEVDDPIIKHIFSSITSDISPHVSFRLVTCKTATVPFIFGIFHPCVVIPTPDAEWTENDWRCIFTHEISHYINGDLRANLLISTFTAFFWWNPFIYLIKAQISRTIEINTDLTVIKSWDAKRRLAYINCLVSLAETSANKRTGKQIPACKFGCCSVTQRAALMLMKFEEEKRTGKTVKLFVVSLSILLFLMPFFITFEAWHIPPEDAQDTLTIDGENSYFIDNGDGTYDLYVNEQFFSTHTSTENFDINITIIEN